MRISDWSSDVCSSDLETAPTAPSPPPSAGTTDAIGLGTRSRSCTLFRFVGAQPRFGAVRLHRNRAARKPTPSAGRREQELDIAFRSRNGTLRHPPDAPPLPGKPRGAPLTDTHGEGRTAPHNTQ